MISKIRKKEVIAAYLFLFPMVIGFLVFMVYPVLSSLYFSFTDFDGINISSFIGFDNYKSLFKDDVFLKSLLNTFKFFIFSVPLIVIFSLIVAALFDTDIKGKNFYRACFFIPCILPIISISMVWKMLYNKENGIFNMILNAFNLPSVEWLTSPKVALISVIIMAVWAAIGINSVIFLSAMQNISPSLIEAAHIDGASNFMIFRKITIPMISTTIKFVSITCTIGAFQIFDQVYAMTAGGPANSTQVVVYHIYNNAFRYFKQGYASSMAYVLFFFIFIFSIIQLNINKKNELV